jgi:preprotein translocase subunit Sss1
MQFLKEEINETAVLTRVCDRPDADDFLRIVERTGGKWLRVQ